MTVTRLVRVLGAGLLAGLFAAGCLPVTTRVPVGTTTGLGADPALIGTWRSVPQPGKDNDEAPAYFHFLKDDSGAITALLVSTGSDKKAGEWSVYRLQSATLGGRRFLDARSVSQDGKPVDAEQAAANIPLLYRVDADGTLSLYLIDEEAAKAAVASGKIAGTVTSGHNGDVVLTAEPKQLDAFFAGDVGAGLFTQKLAVLQRIEP